MQKEVIRKSVNSVPFITIFVFIATGKYLVRKPIKDSSVPEKRYLFFSDREIYFKPNKEFSLEKNSLLYSIQACFYQSARMLSMDLLVAFAITLALITLISIRYRISPFFTLIGTY
jgi:hypothetical protein